MKLALASLLVLLSSPALAADANRLAYLDEDSPFWPTPQSPKFTTPQWIGERGVEAAVILAIDDMRDAAQNPGSAKYEAFLRPILDRLKRIDGRAPVSIMTNQVAPDDPQLQAWLKEGLSLEIHTLAHPCPCLGKMSLEEAAQTYHGGVDLMAGIPNNRPVAFRMPCCDSINSVSPRFFAEIFNRTSAKGHWLAIDSSVFTRPPGERFAKYFPTELRPPTKLTFENYAGFIEDYPYPYVIGKTCWEFPCMVPSDWEAFNALGPKSPTMLEDWKAALDHVVATKGVFTAVFHPHGWSAPEQWVEFIDHAERTHGKRVKFLTFREALDRLEKHALSGASLRATDGSDNGVRLCDVDADGFMDVLGAGTEKRFTRIWRPSEQSWSEHASPFPAANARFGTIRGNATSVLTDATAWTWRNGQWARDEALAGGLPPPSNARSLRDFDRDGTCELLSGSDIFTWNAKANRWEKADFALPPDCRVSDAAGRDNGLRFVDLNGDGFDDVFQSNDAGYAIYLWAGTVKSHLGWKHGWPHLVARGPGATDLANAKILPFVKDGRNYGAWIHGGHVVWQNEDTFSREAYVLRRSFKDLIAFDVPPPKSPEDSLKAMRPRPGFVVELVAAEPLIESPAAFDWDAQGRLWVVEMRDYPLGMDGRGKPGGVVKMLTDSDGDGRYDKAEVFLEDLPFPTGIAPWRNGVLISASPDILFAADTDGDGRADEKRVLFTGFKEGNQQHRMNGFEWGLDGWFYGANGDSGGNVRAVASLVPSTALNTQPVPISGRDFRFRPDTGEFEAESGQGQFGRRRDDWGNWFGNNNSVWLWHYTIEDRYLRRNPKVAAKTVKQVLANYNDATRVYPQSELTIRFNQPQSLGHLTSGCSPCPYRDELFGADYASSVFISEPVHNVVHREVLAANGTTFSSRRADDEQNSEFLASTDAWFRPTTLKTGPDGALYIADFYRFVLEHPEWIAPETQSRLDLRAGSGKGRIYRVAPKDARLRSLPNLAKLDTNALIAALDSPNGWQRDTVQRLLTERGAKEAAPELAKLATKSANPKARVQAIATLGTLQAGDAATLAIALQDNDPHVRIEALRAAEPLFSSGPAEELLSAAASLGTNDDASVRYQLALSLGASRHPKASETLNRLADRDGNDPPMRLAILSSVAADQPLFAKLNMPLSTAPVPNIVLPKPTTPDRARVIASYAGATNLKGAPIHGRELFQQQCGICHRLKGEGHEIGPDLAMVADKPLDWLLTAIFDPNAAIEDRYRAQTVKLKAGTEYSGLISAETANNIVIRLPGGAEVPVLRSDIASRKASPQSLMPEGLESTLKPQDIADLIAWIRAK